MFAVRSMKARHWRSLTLVRDDRGAEQMEYILILAAVVLPMVVAARLMWGVLLYYFTIESFVIDLPLF